MAGLACQVLAEEHEGGLWTAKLPHCPFNVQTMNKSVEAESKDEIIRSARRYISLKYN
jgi:hypothetical protein